MPTNSIVRILVSQLFPGNSKLNLVPPFVFGPQPTNNLKILLQLRPDCSTQSTTSKRIAFLPT